MTQKNKGRKLDRDQRKERMAKVAALYLSGQYQHQIAQKLKCTQQQISYDLAVVRRAWHMSAIRDFDAARERELARIDHLEREYWKGWERSQRDAKTSVEEQGSNDKGTWEKERKVKVGQAGTAAFLQGVQWCIAKRCELLGLEPPKRIDHASGGKPIVGGVFEIVEVQSDAPGRD